MKLIVKTLRPRNPFAAASCRRGAGAHRTGSPRQQARQELRREIDRLRPEPSP